MIQLPARQKYARVLAARRDARVAVAEEQELSVHALDGTLLGSHALTGPFAEPCGLFFSPDGRELWVFADTAQLLRLAVP